MRQARANCVQVPDLRTAVGSGGGTFNQRLKAVAGGTWLDDNSNDNSFGFFRVRRIGKDNAQRTRRGRKERKET
jgi:hypothetical protein